MTQVQVLNIGLVSRVQEGIEVESYKDGGKET